MLGAKLKSWFETQFGRARRRRHKDGSRGRTAAASPQTPQRRFPPPSGLNAGTALHTELISKGATLSSPESAYSTGYSTDATLPGNTQTPAENLHQQVIPRTIMESSPLSVRLRIKDDPPVRFNNPQKVDVCGICGTNSPRRRSRIRTNPWLGPGKTNNVETEPLRSNGRASFGSDGEDFEGAARDGGRASPSDGDTGLDGGDEGEPDDSESDSPSERRRLAPPPRRRRRRPPRRAPATRSAGATPLCSRRAARRPPPPPAPPAAAPAAPAAPAPPPRVALPQALLAADREAERKYRELIREAERILHDMKGDRVPLAHNPHVERLRCNSPAPAFSPKKNHITNFIQNNAEPPQRPPKPPPRAPRSPSAERPSFPSYPEPEPSSWPLSEPVRRKSYDPCDRSHPYRAPDERPFTPQHPRKAPDGQIRKQMLVRTIESLKRSLEEQSDGLQRAHRDPRPQPY